MARQKKRALPSSIQELLDTVCPSPIPQFHDRLSTGSLLLDLATGGGYPWGRMTEVYGEESSGKSLLGIAALAASQRAGGTSLLIDAEGSYDEKWASLQGLNTDTVKVYCPESMEEGLGFIESLSSTLKEDDIMAVVVDSIAALVGEHDLPESKGLEEAHEVAAEARLLSRFFRRPALKRLKERRVALIFINQIREKIGVKFGKRITTPGGRAMRHNAAIRIELHPGDPIIRKIGEDPIGIWIRCLVEKNKTAPPFKRAKFPLFFTYGVDDCLSVVEYLTEEGALEETRGWVSYAGKKWRKGELRDEALRNPELREELTRMVRSAYLEQG